MWVVLVAIFIVTVLCYVLQKQCNYWRHRGIPGPLPLPLIGNTGKYLIGKLSLGEIYTDIYRKYEGHSFVGIYKEQTPCLLIRDIDFIKNIAVKDFKHFADNDIVIDKDTEPLFGRNPFVLKGDEWKKSRSQLTPCFTSGKMKSIFPLVNEVGKRLVKYMLEKREEMTTGVEAKNLSTMFTIENVAVCAFGIEAHCFDEANSEFEYLARNCLNFDGLKLVLLSLVPTLANFLSTKFIPKTIEDRVITIIKNTMKYREDNNITRNDFLQFIVQLSKSVPNFSDVDVAAHAFSFLTDGFETSSHVMSYLLYDLATSPDAQAKLREEINNTFEKNGGEFTYDSIQEMSYLDSCLNESMRKNPPIFFLSKVCTEKYTYTPSSHQYKSNTITLDPGTIIILPVKALHSDSRYFESPEKFIPERFLNKNEITKYAYLPFGEGPRACLGQRFGVMQIKIGVVHIVKNFEMKLNKKTQLPLKYDPWYILPLAIGGLWLNFYKI